MDKDAEFYSRTVFPEKPLTQKSDRRQKQPKKKGRSTRPYLSVFIGLSRLFHGLCHQTITNHSASADFNHFSQNFFHISPSLIRIITHKHSINPNLSQNETD